MPDRAEDFLRQYRFVDLCCHGEGERSFSRSWRAFLPSADLAQIPSLSFLDGTRRFRYPAEKPPGSRTCPRSPCRIWKAFSRGSWRAPRPGRLARWETNRGCPFQCTFATGVRRRRPSWQVRDGAPLSEAAWFSRHRIEFIFCCDANFGILPRDFEITKHVARDRSSRPDIPQALSVQNTKNATERAYAVTETCSRRRTEQGRRALDADPSTGGTLKTIKRDNISLDTYRSCSAASPATRSRPIPT